MDSVEVPTTPLYFNDVVTSAKKAFSFVVNDKILFKNIFGAFYFPCLTLCINEFILTNLSANAHATVGEATNTMNMLGIAKFAVGVTDFYNILCGCEFARDFTSIVIEVNGYNGLIDRIH